MRIKWSCGHEGYINLDWLKRNSYSCYALENHRKSIHPELKKQVARFITIIFIFVYRKQF